MQWGWNPDSFAAVGTVGASVVALIALQLSLRQSKKSIEKDRVAQASQLQATRRLPEWWEKSDSRSLVGIEAYNGSLVPMEVIGFRANCWLPIIERSALTELKYLLFSIPDIDNPQFDLDDFPGANALLHRTSFIRGSHSLEIYGAPWKRVMAPGERHTFWLELNRGEIDREVGLIFRDSNGSEWIRRPGWPVIDTSKFPRPRGWRFGIELRSSP